MIVYCNKIPLNEEKKQLLVFGTQRALLNFALNLLIMKYNDKK